MSHKNRTSGTVDLIRRCRVSQSTLCAADGGQTSSGTASHSTALSSWESRAPSNSLIESAPEIARKNEAELPEKRPDSHRNHPYRCPGCSHWVRIGCIACRGGGDTEAHLVRRHDFARLRAGRGSVGRGTRRDL